MPIRLFLERCHWESRVWVDGVEAGIQNALSASHIYDLMVLLPPGRHTISIRVDNKIRAIDSGANSHSINHIRFHSWCPSEAAFEAADELGIYYQVECSSWPNQTTTLGDGKPIDTFLRAEAERIVKAYGNHPSFCMLACGNEPSGKHKEEYLSCVFFSR